MTPKRVELAGGQVSSDLRRIASSGPLMAYDIEAYVADYPETPDDFGGMYFEILGRHEFNGDWEVIYSCPVDTIEEARRFLSTLQSHEVL
jgi:hypothetical protein